MRPPPTFTIDDIHTLAAHDARNLTGDRQYHLFLIRWWCKQWNRPMKDPLLLSYTFEELLYEFHSVREHEKAIIERAEQETDKIEEAKEQATLDWVEQMEAEEAEEAAVIDPIKDPKNIKWMEEQLALDKKAFGEDFGEDISLDFNSDGKIDK